MLNAAALRIMAAKGLTIEDAAEIAEALAIDAPPVPHTDEQAERRRAKDRERARVRRQSADNPQTSADPLPQKTFQNNLLPTSLNQNPIPPKETPLKGVKEKVALPKPNGFALFWDAYPNKVGKLAAETAYAKALERANAETILAGLDRANGRKWRESLGNPPHPTTWLNQDRWGDEPHEGGTGPPQRYSPSQLQAASDELAFRNVLEKLNAPDPGNHLGNQSVVVPLPEARQIGSR